MENKTKKNIAGGIIAAGGALSIAAINEMILSKKEHDIKEREIEKLEKDKKKYMKKIGAYEPFDIQKGTATADDSKLVNLLTRAVGVAFTNNDVFSRNKSNVRTFPFIISNNNSISAATEVELRKYYEVIVAAQVANLINHTVFAAENILNIKDDDKRSVDKVMDKILSRQTDMSDLGNSLQRGIYENVLFEQDGEVISLNEEYTNAYPTLDQYINDYKRIIKTHVANPSQRDKLIKSMEKIENTRKELIVSRQRFATQADFTYTANMAPVGAEQVFEDRVKNLINGHEGRSFDNIESEEYVDLARTKYVTDFETIKNKYVHGQAIVNNFRTYINRVHDYHVLLSSGITIINNNNFTEPNDDLIDSDPYYRLLDLNRVDNYRDSSQLLMKMFNNSHSLRVKLEMAAGLLISTEILPFEFIDYVTKYLGLPMHNNTRLAISLKYGMGTSISPFRFMGNNYVMNNRDDILRFYSVMRPNEIANNDELVKKLTRDQLRANDWGFFDFLRNRKKLENKWMNNHGEAIDAKLAAVYASSAKLDANLSRSKTKKMIDNVDRQIKDQSSRMHNNLNNVVNSIHTGVTNNTDMMHGKPLSMIGAGAQRVHGIIEDRLKNKIIDLFSVKDVDKSLEYFLNPDAADPKFNPTSSFTPNLTQTQKLIQSIMNEGFEEIPFVTVLSEDFILALTNNHLEESYLANLTMPTRNVTYKEVNKDPIEYILPAYTKGRSLLYGSTEIDSDQFKNRKVGEPIWIKVTFSDKINSMKTDVQDNDFTTVIGIKSEVFRVAEKEINKVLKNPNTNVPDLVEIFRSQRAQTLGLLSKIANENDLKSASLNGVLVVTVNEATTNIADKHSDDFINNPKLAVSLRKNYNLTSICLVDPIAEEHFIMEENSTSWSRLPFSELRASGSNNDLKAIAAIVGRR